VAKVLQAARTWLKSAQEAGTPDAVMGEPSTPPPEAPASVDASRRRQSGAIVGIFALLVFYFIYFASPILIITALLLSMLLTPVVRLMCGFVCRVHWARCSS
jgi:hypothetical protein